VTTITAALAEAQRAEGEAEVVHHHQKVINRDTISGEQLAHRNPRLIHEGGRLRHNKIESEHAAGMHH
jgi:hypothetical protein